MNTLDIINLIDKNSITRLSKDYDNKLINKIKTSFTDTQQQIFVASFYCYLNYDTKKDFVIDFDNVWKWLGYTRKDHAKTCLEKHFVVDIDYKVVKIAPATSGAISKPTSPDVKIKGGQNKERIILSVNTFKKFCMKANTKKADEIHEYYIKLEELLQDTVDEQTDELRLQLQQSDLHIKKLENKILKKQQRLICDDKNYIYIVTSPIHTTDRIYIVGRAVDLPGRLSAYNKTIEHELVYSKACKSREHMNIIETMVLLKLDKYRERSNRDRFILPIDSNISLFIDIVNLAVKWFEDIEEYVCIYDDINLSLTDEELQQKFTDDENIRKEELKEYHKEYNVKNVVRKSKYNTEYYEHNKEEIAKQVKIYRENNKEKIAIVKKIYAENNKQKISEKMKIYAENNKMKNSERKKLHYQNNKQKIVCGCGVELLLQTSIRQKHINSKKHQEFIKNSEEKKEI